MRASFRRGAGPDTAADTLCVGLFEGEDVPKALDDALGGRLARLMEAGDVKAGYRKTAVAHTDGSIGAARVVTVGLGKREEFDAERARIAAAIGLKRAGETSARSIAWLVPEKTDQTTIGGAITEGALLAAYRFDRYKSGADADRDSAPEELEVVSEEDVAQAVEDAAVAVESQNTARDLQNLPANVLTPPALADHAVARANEVDGLEVEVLGPDRIAELEMGGLLAVSKGSHEEPRLIVLRYDGGG